MRTLGGWANETGRLHPASAGTVYAVVRQGTDDELSSSPADRDAWARAGTMTGSNLAVSGKAAWFGTSTAGESRRMVRVGTSPDEELAVTAAEDLQGRASGELADTGVQPEEPGRFPLMWAEYQPGAKGPSRTGPTTATASPIRCRACGSRARSLTPMSAGSPPQGTSAAPAGLTASGVTSLLTKTGSQGCFRFNGRRRVRFTCEDL
jgi:hypothetical protein